MARYKVLTPFLDSTTLEFHEEGDIINVDNERQRVIVLSGIELEPVKESNPKGKTDKTESKKRK